ncbi:cysteine desulfurase family protein [Tenacibaculum dicentrarchi]|uniref:cysteine desulfurase family protein n=1 Tax=Tenacibaculum dicentrarchi TaxID=669041 RepID=UPI000CAC2E4D|nr:Cysteine desulfurase IscS [Tenacibaculum dicentrarchi]
MDLLENEITYLDTASTTRIDARVLKEMIPYFTEYYGNSSSKHHFGVKAKNAIEKARIQVSNILNCDSKEIIFTSGATESINLAIKGFVESNSDKGNHIITVKTEHKAVLATCEYLETRGYEVTYLDVDKNGVILFEQLEKSIKENTSLVAIMYVNNETGVIQPIKKIGEFTSNNNITFLCDATQAIGKINIDVENQYIDMLCFSGHKINAPKGIGVLYKRKEIILTPLFHGGSQENGSRSGTYNTPSIIGIGKACEIAKDEMEEVHLQMNKLMEYLIHKLSEITNFSIVSSEKLRVPNIINLIIPELESDIFIGRFKNIAVSNGSACNSELIEESHVLKAMKPNGFNKNNSLRISIDKFCSIENIDSFCFALKKYLKNA